MRAKIAKLRARPWSELRLWAGTLSAVMGARLGLLALPLAAVTRMVRRVFADGRPLPPEKRRPVRELLWAIESSARHSPVGTTCLATALVGQALLRRHGHEARLRIGVRRGEGTPFAAHAWLEQDGKVIVGGPLAVVETYTPLPDMEHLIA